MLVLSRRLGESVVIYDRETGRKLATIMIAELTKHAVRIGFEADPDIKIVRSEVDVRADKGVKS